MLPTYKKSKSFLFYLANTAYNLGIIFLSMGKHSLRIVVITSKYVKSSYEQLNI